MNLPLLKNRRALTIIIILIILVVVGWRLLDHMRLRAKKQLTPAVNAMTVTTRPMPVLLQATGTIEPVQSVNVRSQVSGIIKTIAFTPGAQVKLGQLLFQIDPAPFQVALEQAQATLARDQAQLNATLEDKKRFEKLIKDGYISQQQFDQVEASVEMQTATVKADEEQVKQAQIQLQYSQIHAPISGVAGNVTVKQGDLVTVASADPLVVINQVNPVMVTFSLPQKNLPKLLRYHNKGPVEVEVWTETGRKLLGKGELVFIDNQVNPQTGTVLLKGSIDNPQQELWPNLMVMVKVILDVEPNAIVVPSLAVQVDQQGHFVYLVQNNKAVVQRVTVDRQVGDQTVISSGLTSGKQVITVAPPNLEAGSKVKVMPAQ